jgi:hypothetical protein
VQKDTVDAHASHRGLHFSPNSTTFPHPTHDQFSAAFDTAHNLRDSPLNIALRQSFCSVNLLQVRQRGAFRRKNMKNGRRSILTSLGWGDHRVYCVIEGKRWDPIWRRR